MLSSLKKSSSEKASGAGLSAWHPNFRNFDRLPDTKVVRTSFFINGVAILIATTLAIYTGYREFGLRTLTSDVLDAKAVAVENKPMSDQAIALYGKFKAEEQKVAALQAFLAPNKIIFSDLVLKLGGDLPPLISLNGIDYKGDVVVLRGGIEGAADEASGLAALYVDKLRTSSNLGEVFNAVTLTSISRDPGSGLIRFEIEMKANSAVANAKGSKK
jgi:hypothetical protein